MSSGCQVRIFFFRLFHRGNDHRSDAAAPRTARSERTAEPTTLEPTHPFRSGRRHLGFGGQLEPPAPCGCPGHRCHRRRSDPSKRERKRHCSRTLVHLVSFQSGTNVSANASPNASVTIVTDAGSSEGIQRVTSRRAGLLVRDRRSSRWRRLFSGDSFTLENLMASARLQRHTMQTHGSKCRPPTAPSPVSRPQ